MSLATVTDDDWAAALEAPAHDDELDQLRTADHVEHHATPWCGVFTEVRVTTYTRTCQACGAGVYRSDPVVSIRTAPWAHHDTGGRWHVLELCRGCGEHRTGVRAA